MMVNIISRFDREQLFSMARGGVLPFLSILAWYVLAEILARVLRVHEIRNGIFINCVAFSSVIFQGLPLGIAIFGEEVLHYIMIYYMAGTVTFWTIGNHRLTATSGQKMPCLSRRTLKVVFSPPIFGFITGMFLVLTGIMLPEPIYRASYYIGSMTTPMAMIFIGIALSRTEWGEIKPDFQTAAAIAGRLFLCPLVLMLMMPFFDVGETNGEGLCHLRRHARPRQPFDTLKGLRRRLQVRRHDRYAYHHRRPCGNTFLHVAFILGDAIWI